MDSLAAPAPWHRSKVKQLTELEAQIRGTNELCQTVLKQMSRQLHSFGAKQKEFEEKIGRMSSSLDKTKCLD